MKLKEGVSFLNMASNYQEDSGDEGSQPSGESCSDFSDSDTDSESAANSGSDAEASPLATSKHNVCKFYNRGHCKHGDKCWDQHICAHFLRGDCKYGPGCRLSHSTSSASGRGGQDRRHSSQNTDDEEWDGAYKWQLNLGKGWVNISNDHILEAQFSLPNTKGITIYNTPAGAISIDFSKMRVLQRKKHIKVRRLSSKDTEWLWYYRGDHSWYQYGGNKKNSPIDSSELEKTYQNNRHGSTQFTVDSTQYEISFQGMCQKNLSSNHRRRVRRRPKYEPSQESGGLFGLTSSFKNLMSSPTNKTPAWQFKGKSQWYNFKKKGGCSVSSDDIESCYQQGQTSMNFTVNGDNYILDFAKMSQINPKSNRERKVRRV